MRTSTRVTRTWRKVRITGTSDRYEPVYQTTAPPLHHVHSQQLTRSNLQRWNTRGNRRTGMDKIIERGVKGIYFFIHTELGHHLPVIQLVYFLAQTRIISGQSVVECCAVLQGEHPVSWEVRGDEGANLLITALSETDHSGPMIVLAWEGVEVQLHAPQTKTEHVWLCVWANCHLNKLHHC